jgi:hypothetical protein
MQSLPVGQHEPVGQSEPVGQEEPVGYSQVVMHLWPVGALQLVGFTWPVGALRVGTIASGWLPGLLHVGAICPVGALHVGYAWPVGTLHVGFMFSIAYALVNDIRRAIIPNITNRFSSICLSSFFFVVYISIFLNKDKRKVDKYY